VLIVWEDCEMALPHDDVGAGAAVVLLHAGIADRTMWTEHLEPLAGAGYRVVAVDLPGFGEAPVAQDEDVPWRDVLETMDALGIDRATLVGNSFGGAVAQRVAAVAPERIISLALISSPVWTLEPSAALKAVEQAEEKALEEGDVEAAVAAVLAAWTLPDASPQLRDRIASMKRRAFELQVGAEWGPEGVDPLEHDLDALSRVEAPASVVVGEHDMPDFHMAADALVEALPDAQKTVLPGAGHLAPLEQPQVFCELLLTVLTGRR
jgi:pimeloyl-ACP methyl ester carboxylesterase